MSELRDYLIREIKAGSGCSEAWAASKADAILSYPAIKEALDFHSACLKNFEVNGEFVVTKENVKGAGGVSAS